MIVIISSNRLAIIATCLLAAGPVSAQIKDSEGRPLRAGEPATGTVRDYNGGTIARGRPARCGMWGQREVRCTFYPRNGDGSFAIDVGGRAYYAAMRGGSARINVDYDNGARMVPQGVFVRDPDDRACWRLRPGLNRNQRICVRSAR